MHRYAIRERPLATRARPTRPGRSTVWDVVAAPSGRVVPWGVHHCPDRARRHLDRLTRKDAAAAERGARRDAAERAQIRSRIAECIDPSHDHNKS